VIQKTEGVVLKSIDFRETSKIVTFFTREHGKLTGILKGIRKDHKKFGSNVDRFSLNDIVYYPSHHSEIHLVSQCDLKNYYFPIRQDLKKSLAASYILELVYLIMPAEDANPKVFALVIDFLETLCLVPEAASRIDPNQLVHMFQIKILLHSGFRPHLDSCIKCKKTVDTKARFSLKEGGLICGRCPAPAEETHPISPGTVASILHVERNSWANCLRLRFPEDVRRELKYILNNFLVYHLGRKIKSARYLT
jgi:DNA repair protein RecO (recombination protein O)